MHRVCAGKLQVHAVEKVLFVALGMHHLEFWRIEETASIQRVRGDEIAPLRTAKRYVKATVRRAKAAVRGFHAAHRFCLAQAGTRRHLDDQTRLVTKFGGRSAEFGDRKSTRLNSSHLVISYAVFCLKKQKKH